VQIPLKLVEPSVADRIQWVHGNLYARVYIPVPKTFHIVSLSLTTQLPFEEDEFDHVHIHSIARGVPENKAIFSFLPKIRSSDRFIPVGCLVRGM